MPADAYLEAEYEDGYVHRETPEDISPYVAGCNIFNDILERRPEQAHGRMVRLSLVRPNLTHNIDWRQLPDNARPIRYMHFERKSNAATGEWLEEEPQMVGLDFGYQYTDDEGQNVQETLNL